MPPALQTDSLLSKPPEKAHIAIYLQLTQYYKSIMLNVKNYILSLSLDPFVQTLNFLVNLRET